MTLKGWRVVKPQHNQKSTKFRVNWPFGSGEQVQKRFSMAAILDRIGMVLAFFDLQAHQYFLPSFESSGLSVQELEEFKILKMAAIFYFGLEQF